MLLKKLPLAGLCCLLILWLSCALPQSNSNTGVEPGKKPPESVKTDREFYAVNFKSEKVYIIYAIELYNDKNCIVYKDWQASAVTESRGIAIGKEFNEVIYPKITDVFGTPLKITEDGKLIIILTDIIDGMEGTNSFIAGYFDSINMYEKDNYYWYSNEAPIVYMDSGTAANVGGEAFYATLAHEFQHLLRFSDNFRISRGASRTETWLDEGLSTAAEYIYLGKHTSSYSNYYSQDPYGAIAGGNTFYFWDNKDYAEYVTVYLFFQWLRIQAEGNSADKYEIYRKIWESGYTDYRGVVAAAKELFYINIDSWEELLGSWLLANYMKTPDKDGALGLYGYNNEFPTLTAHTYYYNKTTVKSLRPGEGVFSAINGTFSPPSTSGANIKYIGASKGKEVNTTGPSFTQSWLLTFNGNTANDEKATAENGQITGVRAAESILRSAEPLPFTIRLDGTHFLPGTPPAP